MALQMARPYKHPKTGVYYFRQHVPTDLRRLLGDKTVSWSLRTKDHGLAKVLNAAAIIKQAMVWERHRKQPEGIAQAILLPLAALFHDGPSAAHDFRLVEHGGFPSRY
ncbi:MAG: DUF6538 domain-containing protein [Pseudomonadota bacterium]